MNASGPSSDDPRADAWERRLRIPVVAAAVAVLPLVALHLTHPRGALALLETGGHWLVWLTFAFEVCVMLCVVRDRRAWIDGHRLELLVVALSSPLIPLALALAPALRLLVVVKAFKALKLAKAIKLAKLAKSVRLLRRRLALPAATSVALGAVAVALAAAMIAYMLTDEAPLKGSARTAALIVAGMLATYGVNHVRERLAGP